MSGLIFPDYGSAPISPYYSAGVNTSATELQNRQALLAQQRTAQFNKLAGNYLSNRDAQSAELLASQFPDEFMKIQENMGDIKAKSAQTDLNRQKIEESMLARTNAAVQKSERLLQQIATQKNAKLAESMFKSGRNTFDEAGLVDPSDSDNKYAPDKVQEMLSAARIFRFSQDKPQEYRGYAMEAIQSLGLDPNDPSTSQDPRFIKMMGQYVKAKAEGVSKVGQVTVNMPSNMPVSKALVPKMQEAQFKDIVTLGKYNDLRNFDVNELLTFQAEFKDKPLPFFEKAGLATPEMKRRIEVRDTFNTKIANLANEAIHNLGGSAVSEGEFRRLQNELLSGALSPTQFKSRLDELIRGHQRSIRLRNRMLREGLDISETASIDTMYKSNDRFDSQEDTRYRANIIMNALSNQTKNDGSQKFDRQQIKSMVKSALEEEGYIDATR